MGAEPLTPYILHGAALVARLAQSREDLSSRTALLVVLMIW